jgi:glycosyltransferase involved in cell wall biosynthesis
MNLIPGLVSHGHRVFLGSSGGDMEQEIRAMGSEVTKYDLRTKSELSWRLWMTMPRLCRFVRERKIDIVHAHTRVTQVAAEGIRVQTGVPNVTTCHGIYKKRLGRRLFPCWGQKSIAISELVREHLIRDFRVAPERIALVSNSLNVSRFDPDAIKDERRKEIRAEYGLRPDSIVFGIVARLAEVKGHQYFIQAFDQLRRQSPDLNIQGLIVGKGEEGNRLRKLVSELGLGEWIHFGPAVSNPVEPLSVIDVFMFPVIWQEGFGLSVLEAMAMEIPVIASRIGAIDTIVQDGETGFLTPVGDINAIAERMERLARDNKLHDRMGHFGRIIVHKKFSLGKMINEVESVYSELVG